GQSAGGVRLAGRAVRGRRAGAGRAAPALAGRAAGRRHPGSEVLLAHRVSACTRRTSRPLPAAPVAGGPDRGIAHPEAEPASGLTLAGSAPVPTARHVAPTLQ